MPYLDKVVGDMDNIEITKADCRTSWLLKFVNLNETNAGTSSLKSSFFMCV